MPPKTGNPKDEEIPALKVERFTKIEGKPWGFDAVAGMEQLKEELKSSFIKPIRFKFMVERLRKNDEIHEVGLQEKGAYSPPEKGEAEGVTQI
jgi:hypothetical protein